MRIIIGITIVVIITILIISVVQAVKHNSNSSPKWFTSLLCSEKARCFKFYGVWKVGVVSKICLDQFGMSYSGASLFILSAKCFMSSIIKKYHCINTYNYPWKCVCTLHYLQVRWLVRHVPIRFCQTVIIHAKHAWSWQTGCPYIVHIYVCSQTYHTMSCILHQAIHVHIVIHAKLGHKFTVGDFAHAWHIGTLNTFIALMV